MCESSCKSLPRHVVLEGGYSLGLLAGQLPLEEGLGVFLYLECTASTIPRNLGLAHKSPVAQGLSAAVLPNLGRILLCKSSATKPGDHSIFLNIN